jgi:hypothetical protein
VNKSRSVNLLLAGIAVGAVVTAIIVGLVWWLV